VRKCFTIFKTNTQETKKINNRTPTNLCMYMISERLSRDAP